MSVEDIKTITNEELKKLKDFNIFYGITETHFGNCLIGIHDDRICFSAFYDGSKPPISEIKNIFPKATLSEDNDKVKELCDGIFDKDKKVGILLKGTEFESNVWKELVNLKKGSTSSYEAVATALGNPKAIRAVARAVAKNNISYLIPCHRVISKSGHLSKYKWGAERKLKILKHENAI